MLWQYLSFLILSMSKRLQRSGPICMAENPMYQQYQIGKWTYGAPKVMSWNEGAVLRIGSFCSIAPNVTILLGGEHRIDWISTYPFNVMWKSARDYTGHPSTKGDVIIGNDVWVGMGAFIRSGVTIGNGAVIGAHSVVTRNVAPYTIAAGNPAVPVKQRFTDEQVCELERLAWWEWPDEEIRAALPLLLSPDISGFIEKYRRD